MRTCSTCGSKNADDAVFCSACGTTFPATPPPQLMQPAGGTTKPVPVVKTITPLAQTPPPIYAPPTVPRAQMTFGYCFYHPELPATYICVRCGKAICVSCTKPYGQLTICPQCYWTVVPRTSTRPQAV